MKKFIIIVAIIGLLTSIGLCIVPKTVVPRTESDKTDYGIGMTYHRATLEDKPMIVLFYVDWCAYCKKFMPKLRLLNAIYQNRYSIVLVNCEDEANKSLVEDFYISSYPTIYIVDDRIKNRVHIDNGYYDNINLLKRELDRYILVRNLIK